MAFLIISFHHQVSLHVHHNQPTPWNGGRANQASPPPAELLGDIVRLPIGVRMFVSCSQSEAVFLI